MEQVVRLQKLADLVHGAVDDRIGDNGAEKSGLELSTFLEVLRPFAARLGKSEVSARRHAPGRLEHRFDLSHETGLRRRKRIRFVPVPTQSETVGPAWQRPTYPARRSG
jgi:hypothetical protein